MYSWLVVAELADVGVLDEELFLEDAEAVSVEDDEEAVVSCWLSDNWYELSVGLYT